MGHDSRYGPTSMTGWVATPLIPFFFFFIKQFLLYKNLFALLYIARSNFLSAKLKGHRTVFNIVSTQHELKYVLSVVI